MTAASYLDDDDRPRLTADEAIASADRMLSRLDDALDNSREVRRRIHRRAIRSLGHVCYVLPCRDPGHADITMVT